MVNTFNLTDVSHITGASTNGAYNDWTNWHSTVNNQVPYYLQSRTQNVKPSVSLNAGANIVFEKNKVDKIEIKPTTTTKGKDQPIKKEWWEDAVIWITKNWAIPFASNVVKNPIKSSADYIINPIPTIIGKGDSFAGTMALLDLPKKVITSSLLNLGRTAQLGRQVMSSQPSKTDYWSDMGKAWDWSQQEQHQVPALDAAGNPIYETNDDGTPKIYKDENGKEVYQKYTDGTDVLDDAGNKIPVYMPKMVDLHDNLDIGTALSYTIAQGTLLPGSVANAILPFIDTSPLQKVANDWGFIYSDRNFDIFNQEQRDSITGVKRMDGQDGLPGQYIEGTGNGWSPGNITVQTFNLVGDVATDPLSYVPFGKVGRIAFTGRHLLTNTTKEMVVDRVVKDATTLAAAAEGKSTVYNNFLNFAAKSDAPTIVNHVVIRSMTTGERDQVAYLLGQVTKPEDAAKVLLSVEYGSTRATRELMRDYGKISLALDETTTGGYITRGITNGKILPENDLLDMQLHSRLYNEMTAYSADIFDNSFAKALRDTSFKVTETGVAPSMIVRELTPVNLRNKYANAVMSWADQTGARIGTFFVNGLDHINAVAIESKLGFGTKNFILHQIVRLGSKDAKGIIDVTNIDGTASNKFFGMLNDIDRITRGALSTIDVSGKKSFKSILTERWMSTTDATARVKLIEEVNAWALNKVAIKHGASDLTAKSVAEELTKRRLIHQTNLDSTGMSIMTVDGNHIIYSDPYAISRGNTEVQLWNWNKVDTEFAKQTNLLKNIIGTPVQAVINTVKEYNSLFNALVVARFARLPRDIMANMVTTIGSGYGKEVLKADLKSFTNIFNPLKRTPGLIKAKLIRKGNLEDTVGAIGKLEEERDIIEKAVLARWEYITQYMETMPIDKTTYDDLINHLALNQILNRETGYLVSRGPIESLKLDKPLIGFQSETDQIEHMLLELGKVVPIRKTADDLLLLPDDPALFLKTDDDVIRAATSNATLPSQLQVRVPNRKREWEIFESGQPIDVTRYEYRFIPKNQTYEMNVDELAAKLSEPDATYYSFPQMYVLGPQDAQNVLDSRSLLYRVPGGKVQRYKPNFYGGRNAFQFDFTQYTVEDLKKLGYPKWMLDLLDNVYKYTADTAVSASDTFARNALGAEITDAMNIYGVGYLKIRDFNGRPVIVGNPSYAQLDGEVADAYGEVINIANRHLETWNISGYQLKKSDFMDPEKSRLEQYKTIQSKDVIPGTPYIIDLKGTAPKPMPEGLTFISKRNPENAENQLFVQIGGDIYGVRFGWDKETRKPIFKINIRGSQLENRGSTLYVIDRNGKEIQTDAWYAASSIPNLTIRDFIRRTELKVITKDSLKSIEKIKESDVTLDSLQSGLDKVSSLSDVERAHLQDMTNIAAFSPEVLMDVMSSTYRYEDVVAQLRELYKNLNFVSGKLNKRQQQLLADTKKRLADSPIQLTQPRKYDDPILEQFRLMDPEFFVAQEVSAALTGRGGDRWFAKIRTDARDVRDQGTGFLVKESRIENKVFKKDDTGYWNAWARTLNEHWRMPDGELDPVIRKWLEGFREGVKPELIRKDIKEWLSDTPAGQKYADAVGIGHKYSTIDHTFERPPATRFEQMSYEDYIEMQEYNVINHVGELGPIESKLEDGIDYLPEDYLATRKQAIITKILKNEDITQEDLVKAWLSPSTEIRKNARTGDVELVGPSEYGQLPDIWGTYADPVGRRRIVDNAKVILRNFNRIVADTPQEILFQSPLFRAAYAKSVERLSTQMRLATGRDFFKEAELKSIEEKARSFALAETRKWVYSSQEQRNIMNAIRQVVPFANATLFTAKWMANVAKERPVYAAWMVYEYNKAISGVNWVDQNGNPVSYNQKDKDGKGVATHFRFDYPAWLVNALAGKPWNDSFGTNYVSKEYISKTSIDPIWNGNNVDLWGTQVPNPFVNWGVTPGVAIAISELIKENLKNPNSVLSVIGNSWSTAAKAGLVPDLAKFGVSQTPGSVNLAIPPALSNTLAPFISNGVDPTELIQLKVNASIYLYGRLVAGTAPTGMTEKNIGKYIDAYALGMYDLKHNSSFWMPFATKYVNESDIARNTWQTYIQDEQNAYDQMGPEAYTASNLPNYATYKLREADLPGAQPYYLNPYDVALSKFLNEQPDIFFGAISSGSGGLKLRPSGTTAENITRYNDLIGPLSQTEEGRQILSDVLNGDSNSATSSGSYTFDQNVYNLLVERKLVSKSTPDESSRRVKIARGNQLFRTGVDLNGDGVIKLEDGDIVGMNELDNLAYQWNVPIDSNKILTEAKAKLVRYITNQKGFGQVWADNRSSLNPQRYNTTADAWNAVLGNEKWSKDTEVVNDKFFSSVQKFLEWRGKWQLELHKRSEKDPTLGTLSKNPDIEQQYYDYVFVLKNYDTTGKFSEWYNTYFEGDTVN